MGKRTTGSELEVMAPWHLHVRPVMQGRAEFRGPFVAKEEHAQTPYMGHEKKSRERYRSWMKKQPRSEVEFGEIIKEFRLAAGLSQDGLADRMDLSKSYIFKLEKNLRSPSPEMLIRLGRALGINPGALLDKAAESYPPAFK